VVQNPVENAAKFMGHQPDPRIMMGRSGEENGMPVFYIKDDGVGISKEHYDRVFGLFNKLDPISDGTGIRLALAGRLIEFHRGRVWIVSEVGKGTAFLFTLPPGAPPDSVI
jgi:signal transduction histidine kinase